MEYDDDPPPTPTTEETFALDLADILANCNTSIGLDVEIIRVGTFAESGLLTRDSGVIVCLNDGTEFQLTVVRSR
jgi:hypothetical protein